MKQYYTGNKKITCYTSPIHCYVSLLRDV